MNKAKLNYWVDLLIAVAFVVSGISGLMFLLPASWAAVREDGLPRLLGLTLLRWSDVHTFGSLVMMAGVALHLALHARWIRQMTKCTFSAQGRVAARAKRCDNLESAPALRHGTCSRRRFLRAAGWSMVAVLGAGVVYTTRRLAIAPLPSAQTADDTATPPPEATSDSKAHAFVDVAETAATATAPSATESPTATASSRDLTSTTRTAPAPTGTSTIAPTNEPAAVTVQCPRGMVYDPYPGRCRLYVDRNDNGYCDYSEPMEG